MTNTMTWSKAQDLLAPLRETPQVGSSIAARQPDVEILAVLLQDTPSTAAAFDGLRRTNEWVSVSFAVVAVGPAGFSSVPYTAGKKDKDESTLPLYHVSETGTTVFSTFEKVKNNKDRGKRVQVMEVDGVAVPASAELPPGLILSTFLREDTFGSGSAFVVDDGETPEVLPAGSFVWMQLGVKNCEQAAKGQLLKFKKMKFCRQPSHAMSTAFRLLPRDKDACVAVCSKTAAAFPAIAKQIYASGKNAVVGADVAPRAFVNYNELERTITLSGYLGSEHVDPEVVFDAELLLRENDFYDPARLVRFLNCVAIPSNAVGVVVLAQTKYDDDSVAYKGVAMHVDLSQILQLALLQENERCPASGGALDVHMKDDILLWSNPHIRIQHRDEQRRLVFALHTKPVSMRSALNDHESSRFVSDGCGGKHSLLAVHAVPLGESERDERDHAQTWDGMCEQVLTSMRQRGTEPRVAPAILVLQVRSENRGAALHKRKRPVLELGTDSRDMDMLDEMAVEASY